MSKFCHNCGAQLKETSKFCPKCGTPLRHREHPEQIQQAPQPIQQAVQQVAQPVRQAAQNVVGQAAEPITQAAQNIAGQATQPAQRAVQQAAQNVVGQAAQQFGQGTVGQTVGNFRDMQNVFNALSAPGEAAITMPGVSALSAAKGGGLPGFVLPLVCGVAAGGLSIPLLNQLPSPWSLITGLFLSVITIVVSTVIKKSREGGKR